MRKTEAASWHSSLINPDIHTDDDFKAEAKDSMDKVVLSWIVALFKQTDYKLMSVKAATKTLDTLLLCSKERRPFALLTLETLKKLANEKSIKTTGLKKEALIDQLLKPVGEANAG